MATASSPGSGCSGTISLTVLLREKHAAEGFQDTQFSLAKLVHPEATAYVRKWKREELLWQSGGWGSSLPMHGPWV